jgi:hypothetical protein
MLMQLGKSEVNARPIGDPFWNGEWPNSAGTRGEVLAPLGDIGFNNS